MTWLYSHYPQPAQASAKGSFFEPTGRSASLVFDAPMIALMRENDRLTPKGDVGAIDSDPICDCQDDSGLIAKVGEIVATGPDTATAAVDLRFSLASPPEVRHLKFSLVTQAGQWRIHDIDDGDTPSLRAYLTQANIDDRKAQP